MCREWSLRATIYKTRHKTNTCNLENIAIHDNDVAELDERHKYMVGGIAIHDQNVKGVEEGHNNGLICYMGHEQRKHDEQKRTTF